MLYPAELRALLNSKSWAFKHFPNGTSIIFVQLGRHVPGVWQYSGLLPQGRSVEHKGQNWFLASWAIFWAWPHYLGFDGPALRPCGFCFA